jgi:hypothetical protein
VLEGRSDRVTASHGCVFVVRRFDFHVESCLVEIALAPRLLQTAHFVVVELAANELLQLLATDLLQGLFLLGGLETRLVARLHAYAEGGVEGYGLDIAADLGAARGGFVDVEKLVARGLEGEGRGVVGHRNDDEGLFG